MRTSQNYAQVIYVHFIASIGLISECFVIFPRSRNSVYDASDEMFLQLDKSLTQNSKVSPYFETLFKMTSGNILDRKM